MRDTGSPSRHTRLFLLLVVLLSLSSAFFPSSSFVRAANPTALRLSAQPVVRGFSSPVFATNAGDDRIFVVEQVGRIRIVRNGMLLSTPFLDITGSVLSGGEEGLLSVAFHPQYATNGFLYVYHTITGGNNVVERYHVSASPDQADASSRMLILTIPHPNFPNHNGGLLTFGTDGLLYIGTGDGGGGGDPNGNGQKTTTLLGKILRIDVNRGNPYAIPADNPFANDTTGKAKEIWAYGLRNPWRYAFDPPSGLLYIADVGQSNWEEVDAVTATTPGVDYGWNIMEGMHCYPPGTATCNISGLTLPVTEYDHSFGCSITGGYVYRGSTYPQMVGLYFFADFCSGRIWALDQPSPGVWRKTDVLDTSHAITSFGLDRNGELYLTDGNDGGLYHLVPTPPNSPLPGARPSGGSASGPSAPLPSTRPSPPGSGGVPNPLPQGR
jgi:glucose/arabinose dehydrogenase